MADKKAPSYVGFKPSEKDLKNIAAIKGNFPLPEEISTAQVLKMALEVYAKALRNNP